MLRRTKCWLCYRLREPSTWVAIAVPIGTLGTQIDKPYSTAAFVASAVCSCLGVILGEDRNGNDSSISK